jgi:hypothetical protein
MYRLRIIVLGDFHHKTPWILLSRILSNRTERKTARVPRVLRILISIFTLPVRQARTQMHGRIMVAIALRMHIIERRESRLEVP